MSVPQLKHISTKPADYNGSAPDASKSSPSPAAGGVDSSSVSSAAWGIKLKKAPRPADYDGKVPNVSVKPESSPTDSKTTEFEAVKLKVTGSAPKAPAATEDDQKQTEENIFTTKGLKKVADSPVQKELEAIAAAEAKPDSGKSSGLAMA